MSTPSTFRRLFEIKVKLKKLEEQILQLRIEIERRSSPQEKRLLDLLGDTNSDLWTAIHTLEMARDEEKTLPKRF